MTVKNRNLTGPLVGSLLLLIGLTSCRSIPDDIRELMLEQQEGMVWVAGSKKFSLNGRGFPHRLVSHEKVTVSFDQGGDFVWSDAPSIRITTSHGVSTVAIPKDFIDQNGKYLPSSVSGQPYGIRLYRMIHTSREWVVHREVSTPNYQTVTIINADGTISVGTVQNGWNTRYYDDYYLDGEIEYRLGFYDGENQLVAIVYVKKPVKGFFNETVEVSR